MPQISTRSPTSLNQLCTQVPLTSIFAFHILSYFWSLENIQSSLDPGQKFPLVQQPSTSMTQSFLVETRAAVLRNAWLGLLQSILHILTVELLLHNWQAVTTS